MTKQELQGLTKPQLQKLLEDKRSYLLWVTGYRGYSGEDIEMEISKIIDELNKD